MALCLTVHYISKFPLSGRFVERACGDFNNVCKKVFHKRIYDCATVSAIVRDKPALFQFNSIKHLQVNICEINGQKQRRMLLYTETDILTPSP